MLVCRNTLMYFNAETQARILSRFHFALSEGGVLFLGKAEMLLSHGNLFSPTELRYRVFRRVPRLPLPLSGGYLEPIAALNDSAHPLDELRTEAFAASPVAQLVLTSDGLVALTNRQLEQQFAVTSRDIGRPFRDLDISYRPVELRKYIEQAQVERRSLRVTDVEYTRAPGEVVNLEIQVSPLTGADGSLLGVNLIFSDVTAGRRLQDELEQTNQRLEAAYEELQSTNEELETTNEELQSTVEELETTNEELQSTNEELETMNEELQSANDELQGTNEQLRDRTGEVSDLNAFMQSVLSSFEAAVIVLDRDLVVTVWTPQAQELWGLRPEEAVGRELVDLDSGLPVAGLEPWLRAVLDGTEAMVSGRQLSAVNRRGRTVELRVSVSPLPIVAGVPGAAGVLLVLEDVTGP